MIKLGMSQQEGAYGGSNQMENLKFSFEMVSRAMSKKS